MDLVQGRGSQAVKQYGVSEGAWIIDSAVPRRPVMSTVRLKRFPNVDLVAIRAPRPEAPGLWIHA